jgi:cell wall-associated NlpC family hydrolase
MVSKVESFILLAQSEIGTPYVWGGEEPGGFDCSGLMQFALGKVGIKAPRTAASQQKWATPVSSPAPGDLVFWGTPAYHVALYVGQDASGKQTIIQAPHAGANVQQVALWGKPSGYGRVPGLGAGAGATVSAVGTSLTGWTSDLIDSVLGSARHIAIEVAVAGAGLALVGYGLYRLAKPAATSAVKELA